MYVHNDARRRQQRRSTKSKTLIQNQNVITKVQILCKVVCVFFLVAYARTVPIPEKRKPKPVTPLPYERFMRAGVDIVQNNNTSFKQHYVCIFAYSICNSC